MAAEPAAETADTGAVDSSISSDAPSGSTAVLTAPVAPAKATRVDHLPGAGADLPAGALTAFAAENSVGSPGHHVRAVEGPKRLPMMRLRILAFVAVLLAFVLTGWQIARVINEQERLAVLSIGPLISALIGAAAVVIWTYRAAENARRILDPATSQQMPRPGSVAASWWVPLIAIAGAAAVVAYLSRRLNTPIEGTESSLPLLLALGATVLALPLMYWPATQISCIVRKIGGHGVKLGQWLLVPVVLAAVGGAMIFGLRAGDGVDDIEQLIPTWIVAVAMIVPATVLLMLGWRAADSVESDVVRAFDRRLGTDSSTTKKRTRFSSIHASEGPNATALADRGHIRQIPGSGPLSALLTAGVAGLALLSVIGALIMFLFWRESLDGVQLASQGTRAWSVLEQLQRAERFIAVALVGVAAVWSFVAVTNVRMASARHRNPLIAAIAWPISGASIWIIADRFVSDESLLNVLLGFALQAVALYIPIAILQRSATSIGSQRSSHSLVFGVGVVLLVHIQGLGGLSTLTRVDEAGEFARLAGYLAIGGLVLLLGIFAVAEATRTLNEAAQQEAEHHNFLANQRASIVASARPSATTAAE